MRIRSLVNILLFLLGVSILGLMVVLADPSEIWEASKKTDWKFTVSGLVVFTSYLFVRSLRWHAMVKVIKEDVSWKDFMPVYFLNFMISNITPGRSGEAAAPFLMKRHVGSETGMGFSVVIVDRILDILFTVGLAVLGFVYCVVFLDLPRNLIIAFYPAIAVLVAMTGVMIMITLWRKGAFAFSTAFTNVFFRKRQKQLLDGLDSFYEGLKTLRQRKVMPKLLTYATLSWFLLGFSYFLRVRAVLDSSALLPILSCWIISLCIGMASFIPSGLGSSQASFAYLLSLMGNRFEYATAAALLTKFIALGVIFLLGLSSLFWLKHSEGRH
ncbi:lysylphosphatidylglycerol synthase transmembrane domain-containing protein [Candidatus Poribacteria bacterium]